jgi:hypothetical protein
MSTADDEDDGNKPLPEGNDLLRAIQAEATQLELEFLEYIDKLILQWEHRLLVAPTSVKLAAITARAVILRAARRS